MSARRITEVQTPVLNVEDDSGTASDNDAVPGLRPLGLAEGPVRVDGDPLAADVYPGGLFPAPPDGLVGELA